MDSLINVTIESTTGSNELFTIPNIIAIVGIIVQAFLAWYIVHTLQTNLTKRRVLKDHLIHEFKDLKQRYLKHINDLNSNKLDARPLPAWHKEMNISLDDMCSFANKYCRIDTDSVKPYYTELRIIILDSPEFIKGFQGNGKVISTSKLQNELLVFMQKNGSAFDNIIFKINDA